MASDQPDPYKASYAGCHSSGSHGVEGQFDGVVDRVRWKAVYKNGAKG